MVAKWNLVFDVARCINCQNCVLSVQDEYVDNAFPGYSEPMPRHGHRWFDIRTRERGKMPIVDVSYLVDTCQHCDDAPCRRAAPEAVHKRDDGIVVIDPEKARGRRDLVDACPYGAIWWNEALEVPQHWTFDAHLLDDGWPHPRCVQACPTAALEAHKISDEAMQALAAEQGLTTLRPELGTKPRVYIRNHDRFAKQFIAGSFLRRDGEEEICVEGVEVVCLQGDQQCGVALSDAFGDFKIDGLAGGESYRLEIRSEKQPSRAISVDLVESVYLGEIEL